MPSQRPMGTLSCGTYSRLRLPSELQGPISHRLWGRVSSRITAPVCQLGASVDGTLRCKRVKNEWRKYEMDFDQKRRPNVKGMALTQSSKQGTNRTLFCVSPKPRQSGMLELTVDLATNKVPCPSSRRFTVE